MERSLKTHIQHDVAEKMVFVTGPRQVGKTYLSKQIVPESFEYLNYDSTADRRMILKETWRRDRELLIFDELHKMRKWKSWLKGVYDSSGNKPSILVTGSARLETFRRGGDSLAGRFFSYRLHPFSVAEMSNYPPAEALDGLLRFGGFPEPFLKGSESAARRWRRTHVDVIVREDLLDLEQVRDLRGIELLVELLSERVGSQISYASLGRDLQVSPHTVKNWVRVLEALYVVFVVPPYTKNIARSILKEPKIYFYDNGQVAGDEGARFENLVASSLLKQSHFLEDTLGDKCKLHYIRDKQKREVDFLLVRNGKVDILLEAKVSDDVPTNALHHFSTDLKPTRTVLAVRTVKRQQRVQTVDVLEAATFLATLER